jgi:hypothetical protein
MLIMKRFLVILLSLVGSIYCYSQADSKPVIVVNRFSSEVDNPRFAASVQEKVSQIVVNSKRFTVRISDEEAKDEVEARKSEIYLDNSENLNELKLSAYQFRIIGHLIKANIYTMKNPDGSVNGYKASCAFTLKVNDVESGSTTEAESFQTEVSPIAASKEQAINQTLQSIEPKLNAYFVKTFPLQTKIVKFLDSKKCLIAGGKSFGLKEGDKLVVERVEMLDGKPYPTEIGELKITKVSGDDFSECAISKGNKEILAAFNAAEKLNCKLIVK